MQLDWQQVSSTFIGASLGFIFSIALFYLIERWRARWIHKGLCDNLQKEFDFNIVLITEMQEGVEEILRKITANNPRIYTTVFYKFRKLQRLFIFQAFDHGMVYKYL